MTIKEFKSYCEGYKRRIAFQNIPLGYLINMKSAELYKDKHNNFNVYKILGCDIKTKIDKKISDLKKKANIVKRIMLRKEVEKKNGAKNTSSKD